DLREIDFIWREPDLAADTPLRQYPLDLGASVGMGYSTVRAHALSLGPQEGISTSARVQARRYLDAPGWNPTERDYWRATALGRAFQGLDWFGFAPPVLALSLRAGVEGSSATPGFSLGGGRGIDAGLDLTGGDVDYPVRGFPRGAQRGNRVVSTSAEYRFPIALVERGLGLFPLAVDRLW